MTATQRRRLLALIDGEHYPPVVRAALRDLAARCGEVVAALVLGGTEKVAAYGAELDVGVPVTWPPAGADLAGTAAVLEHLCATHRPDVVYDLSDEPVLDARARTRLAAHALRAGADYRGADFAFTAPPRPRVATRPSVAVVGTGKRTGKTGVNGEFARRLLEAGTTPVVVAMGRGGPPDPLVVPAGSVLGPEALLEVADAGGHAASDFYEDALTTGAATVGARRCGGGMAGGVAYSNVAEGVRAADDLPGDLTLLEGSGAALPPVHADATVLVAPGDADPELLVGYLGAYRVLLADLVVVTMCESPRSSPPQVESVLEALRSISRTTPCLRTVFRPMPLGQVSGARVFFATTAPAEVSGVLTESLEDRFGCDVVATSNHLADRPRLQADLEAAPAYEVLLVECKAAAVDVAARIAARAGARVVFCDNRPVPLGPDGSADVDSEELTDALLRVAQDARRRFAAAGGTQPAARDSQTE